MKESSLIDRIPFMFLTGHSELEEIRFGLDLGVDDYFVKPFNNNDLIKSIEKRLAKFKKLTDNFGVKLNFQKFEYNAIASDYPTPEEEFNLVAKNIDYLYDEKATYSSQDIPISELVDWLGNLTMEQYSKIAEFYLNEPKIYKKLDLTCKKCNMEHHLNVEDIFDFFE